MSEQPKPYIPATLAQELGITVIAEDVPRIVAAIKRAYGAGLQDGATFERELCAQVCEKAIASILEYGPEEVKQTGRNVCMNLTNAIRARGNHGLKP